MKNILKVISIVFLSIGILAIVQSCRKENNTPTVVTYANVDTIFFQIPAGLIGYEVKGYVIEDGGAEVTDRGICYSNIPNPTINSSTTDSGTGLGPMGGVIIDLTPNTTYYFRAFATNNVGTGYGEEVSFTTLPEEPVELATLTTADVTSVNTNSAVSGGKITEDGGGIIAERGICWSTHPLPTISDSKSINGEGTRNFTSNLTGLNAITTYYVRAYATNGAGTAYGNELNFTTYAIGSIIFNSNLAYGSVSDIDGNIYKTIQIGTQIWMAENLRTTKFNDGVSIPHETVDIEWEAMTTPGYCWYSNDPSSFRGTYGGLYNWYAVNTGKLCPAGWHMPTNAEWNNLSYFLGINAGGKMKETGTTKWVIPNTGASNISGFTAIPGGSRDPLYLEWSYSTFNYLGYYSSWWSANESVSLNGGYAAGLSAEEFTFNSEYIAAKIIGLSVRCLKD